MPTTNVHNYCFTHFSEDEFLPQVVFPQSWGKYFQFAIWSLKKLPECNDRLYVFGYVHSDKPRHSSHLKKLCNFVNWEKRKGTHQQAIEYICSTDNLVDGPWTYGYYDPLPSKRTNILALKNEHLSGSTPSQIAYKNYDTWVYCNKCLFRYYKRLQRQKRRQSCTSGCASPPHVKGPVSGTIIKEAIS